MVVGLIRNEGGGKRKTFIRWHVAAWNVPGHASPSLPANIANFGRWTWFFIFYFFHLLVYADDMDEKHADEEGAGLIEQESTSKDGRTSLRSLAVRLSTRWSSLGGQRDSSSVAAKLLTDSNDDDEVGDAPLTFSNTTTTTLWRFVPSLRSFILAVVSFTVGIGVACGLGLGLPYNGFLLHLFNSSPEASTALFDEFGVPRNLPTIPSGQLANKTELDLATNFTVSRTPTLREYEFNISHALAAPDGQYKPMVVANGQSPGPLIEANTGDTVRVRVNNWMPNTTTSVHFHGLKQGNSTWMDGVAGVTQCGIPPGGGSWTYEFVVREQRGTFWWHAHLGVQFTDGLFGPIVSLEYTKERKRRNILTICRLFMILTRESHKLTTTRSSFWARTTMHLQEK